LDIIGIANVCPTVVSNIFGVHTASKNPRRGMVRPRYRPASVLKDVDYFKMSAFATATKCLCLNRVLVYLHLMDRLKKYPLFFFLDSEHGPNFRVDLPVAMQTW
jgi:hypothetical protein